MRRPDLIDRLYLCTTATVTLVVAPPGYGKTWTLTEFASTASLPVSWYSLELDDADPSVLIGGLAASVANTFPQAPIPQPKLTDPSPSGIIAAATELLEAIERNIPEVFVTVVDDLHLVDSSTQVLALLEFMLRHMPDNWRLVMATRRTPRLRLINLIASGAVSGIGKAELAFTETEVAQLLQRLGADPDPRLADEIHRTTEGWPLAVSLVARTYASNPHGPSVIGNLGHQAVEALLWDVVDQLPQWREEILALSIFDQVGPEELNAVAGHKDSQELSTVVANLPLVTEIGRGRFAFHDLFKTSLRKSFRDTRPLAYMQMHRLAATIYMDKWPDLAARHLLAADLHSEAADLLQAYAGDLFRGGRWEVLVALAGQLPRRELLRRPALALATAKALDQLGRNEEALNLFSDAVVSAEIKDEPSVLAEILAERSTAYRIRGMLYKAREDAQRALELTPSGSAVEAACLRNLGIIDAQLGHGDTAADYLERAADIYRAIGDQYCVALCCADLANLQLNLGRTAEAHLAFQQAITIWRELENRGNLALALNGAAVVANLSGDWEGAEGMLLEALDHAKASGYVRAEAYVLASLADLRMDQGDFAAAKSLFEQAHQKAKVIGEGYVSLYALNGLARACRAMGDIQEALHWNSRALQGASELPQPQERVAAKVIQAHLLLEIGGTAPAAEALEQALKEGEHLLDPRRLVLANVLKAYLYFRQGDIHPAVLLLEQLTNTVGVNLLRSAELAFARPLFAHGRVRGHLPGIQQALAAWVATTVAPSPTPEPSVPTVYARLLGPVEVLVKGHPITEWEAQSARDLFVYLLHLGRPERRDVLMELFWPEQPPGKAASALQSALYRVRRLLGKQAIRHHQGWYSLELQVATDVKEFEASLWRAQEAGDPSEQKIWLLRALEIYRGDYLESIYADWPEAKRHELRELRFEAMRQLCEIYYAEGEYPKVVLLSQQALTLDPYRETFHRALMRAKARSGDRAGALEHYSRLERLLQKELSMSPEPATRMLYETIAQGRI